MLFDSMSKRGGDNICLPLLTKADEQFQINFVLRKSTSEGLILLDDIELSQKLCPRMYYELHEIDIL